MGIELLEIEGVSKNFEGIRALQNVSFKLKENRIESLIGPNGAGKTTILNLISGMLPWDTGTIHFQGKSLKNLAPHQITSLGLSRTFQDGGLFRNLTVLENALLGFHCRFRPGLWSSILYLPWRQAKNERRAHDRASELLQSFGLGDKQGLALENLPLDGQRLVEIISALAVNPKLLMLDEPSAGLNDTEIHDLIDLLFKIRDQGTSILLIEHNMEVVMKVSEKILVLNYGVILAQGSPNEIQNDDRVIKAYLGE